jgi:hypothetical protein
MVRILFPSKNERDTYLSGTPYLNAALAMHHLNIRIRKVCLESVYATASPGCQGRTHLAPMSKPTNHTRNCKQHREEIHREAHSTVNQPTASEIRSQRKKGKEESVSNQDFAVGEAKRYLQKSTFGASLREMKYSSFIATSCKAIAVSRSSSRPVLRNVNIDINVAC